MFDSRRVNRLALIEELRAQVQHLEGRRQVASLPVHEALAPVVQLQAGHAYAVNSATMAMLLMAGPSMGGAWCAVVGTDSWGIEAAQAMGVDLSRLVLVPEPGSDWINVVGALIDAVDVVILARSFSRQRCVTEHDAARIKTRLQRKQAILIAWDIPWPRVQATLRLSDVRWFGIGSGQGYLQARQATIEVHRNGRLATALRLWLPDADRVVRPVDGVAAVAHHDVVPVIQGVG